MVFDADATVTNKTSTHHGYATIPWRITARVLAEDIEDAYLFAQAIILLRHGQTDYNKALRMQGQIDIPLNDEGRSQASAASLALAGMPIGRIYTSDLSRARETAEILAKKSGVEAHPDVRLRERSFGSWEGMTREELMGAFPTEYGMWRAGQHPNIPGIETREEVAIRVGSMIAEAADQTPSGTVAVLVGHGAALTLGIAQTLDLSSSWHGISGMNNCHWSVLIPTPQRQPSWRLAAHNIGVQPLSKPHLGAFETPPSSQ